MTQQMPRLPDLYTAIDEEPETAPCRAREFVHEQLSHGQHEPSDGPTRSQDDGTDHDR
jgi:hypothetical protein